MGYVRLQHVTNYQLDLDLIFWALGHFQLLTLDTTTGTFAPCGLVRVTAEFSVNRARSANIKRPETAETRRFDTRFDAAMTRKRLDAARNWVLGCWVFGNQNLVPMLGIQSRDVNIQDPKTFLGAMKLVFRGDIQSDSLGHIVIYI